MGGSSICISGEDPESKPLSEIFIFGSKLKKKCSHFQLSKRYLSVDCSVATQQVKIKVMLEATKEFCETVGIVGYLSSRDDRAQPLWPILPNSVQILCLFFLPIIVKYDSIFQPKSFIQ